MEIKTEVRQYIAENFLPNAPIETIDDSMPLISGGVIDSIGMIGLVAFLESRYEVEFMPREIDVHNLDTIEQIEEVMRKKLASGSYAPPQIKCDQSGEA
ncbi:MAG: acyl carrier protein [Terracidiphilus sp.]